MFGFGAAVADGIPTAKDGDGEEGELAERVRRMRMFNGVAGGVKGCWRNVYKCAVEVKMEVMVVVS